MCSPAVFHSHVVIFPAYSVGKTLPASASEPVTSFADSYGSQQLQTFEVRAGDHVSAMKRSRTGGCVQARSSVLPSLNTVGGSRQRDVQCCRLHLVRSRSCLPSLTPNDPLTFPSFKQLPHSRACGAADRARWRSSTFGRSHCQWRYQMVEFRRATPSSWHACRLQCHRVMEFEHTIESVDSNHRTSVGR